MFLNQAHAHGQPSGHMPGLLKLFHEKCVCVYVCLYVSMLVYVSFCTHMSKFNKPKAAYIWEIKAIESLY